MQKLTRIDWPSLGRGPRKDQPQTSVPAPAEVHSQLLTEELLSKFKEVSSVGGETSATIAEVKTRVNDAGLESSDQSLVDDINDMIARLQAEKEDIISKYIPDSDSHHESGTTAAVQDQYRDVVLPPPPPNNTLQDTRDKDDDDDGSGDGDDDDDGGGGKEESMESVIMKDDDDEGDPTWILVSGNFDH